MARHQAHKANFTGVNIDRIVNGRIVKHVGAVNLLRPLLDIGAIRLVGPEDE